MPRKPRCVLITGGGSGIGQALAMEAAARGMMIALCGRRRSTLEQAAVTLTAEAPPILIEADVTEAADRARIVARLAKAWGSLDLLINNAGVVTGGAVKHLGDDALERTFRINAIAPMALSRDFATLLSNARPSRVVNIGSMFGDIAYPGFAAYSASKFALRGFSSALRREWQSLGIGVTYVAPRATRTAAAFAFHDLIARTRMRLDEPEHVARSIWRAIDAGQNELYPPGAERLYVLIQRLAPKIIDRALARIAK